MVTGHRPRASSPAVSWRVADCVAGHANPADPATSVHRLRPGDIRVVAALGDSVTTGWAAGASRLSAPGTDYRGASWSGGGGRSALTLPNILRHFSPGLAARLVRRLRRHPRIDVARHWKLVTIMIGGNDICQSCAAGDAQLPRTFVNLVPVVDMGEVRRLVRGYQRSLARLVASGRYDTRRDFTVVVQPFTLGAVLPRRPRSGLTDTRFVAVDCFHPSRSGQELMALMLWNNMVTPVAAKSTDGREAWRGFKCPSPAYPFLGTYRNWRHGG
ncbi:phospholipase B1, membrane-associated-like [Pollicipes pollicipes]|uniref:phospholipase B1, membrane-associated-like n=1 Tax=Pollicipes pollicipes TaxID=41117 RepID=UPI0018851946|nr:phospholipase B1, membrane-associated-like [Pollicipes pollicipes]